ncbi:MAG: carbonic anhydrase [Verrucomicrobiales bacterium]|nr:carbonic anhydrase [Verrucomicrobiales bacterium]
MSSTTVPAADHGGGGNSKQAMRMLRDAALVLLKEGNVRFHEDKATHPSVDAERREAIASEGQAPLVTVLACADSRAPVELVFDRGLGEIFTIRVAGNVADTDEIATVEYGVGHLGTPLLVVLGHSKCGAVTAVVKGSEVHGLLPQLLDNIQPAVERAKAEGGEETAVVDRAIKENVYQSMADILRRSSVVRGAVEGGSVRMVGAVYDLHSGKVEWLGDHPEQKQILAAWSEGAVDHAPAPTNKRLTLAADLPDPADAPHAETAPKVASKPAPVAAKPAVAADHDADAVSTETVPAPTTARPPRPVAPAAAAATTKPSGKTSKPAAVAPKGAAAEEHH